MKKLLLTVCVVAALAGCTDDIGANRALLAAGYTNIIFEGYTFFGCSEGDLYHTKFSATGANGQKVSGVVCAGLLKGSTIRMD